jgi:hypothetical protein
LLLLKLLLKLLLSKTQEAIGYPKNLRDPQCTLRELCGKKKTLTLRKFFSRLFVSRLFVSHPYQPFKRLTSAP